MKELKPLDLTDYSDEEIVMELHYRTGALWKMALALHHRYQTPTNECINFVCEKCQKGSETFLHIERELNGDNG